MLLPAAGRQPLLQQRRRQQQSRARCVVSLPAGGQLSLPRCAPGLSQPISSSSRSSRRAVLLHAKKRATESAADGDDDEPAPAKAGRKGRKTKEEVEAAAVAAAEAAAVAEAEDAAADEAAAAEWLDAGGSPEEDRRRFPYHRRLQTAASEGNIDGAESAFSSMEGAGLAAGPRAFHVLLCAYLKGGDTPGALGVGMRATEAGVKLLPESYAVLIYAALESSPPDVAVAKTLYQALSGTDTEAQQPWSVLCRLLAAKGFATDAVAVVKEGFRAGLQMDADVAEAYVKALCDTQELDAALTFLETMAAKHGLQPEARHVTYVVAGLAAAGNFDDASSLIDAAGNRGWGRTAATFNALLAGIVQQLQDDDKEGTLAFTFVKMTGRMVQSSVRPNKFTFKLEAEGHIKLGDARSAMGSLKSLRTAAGTGGLRLLEASALSGLLQLLSERDMPVDMLQLLVYMAEDGCRMPVGALVPDGQGRTPLDAWLNSHLEGMSARTDQRTTEAAMLNAPLEYVNGIPLGPGLCVVDEGGSIVPVSKCSVKELRAEAEARSILGAQDMKKAELAAAIKAARARLPFNVLQAQVKTAGEGVRGGSKKKAAAGAGKARKATRKGPVREVWAINAVGDVEVRDAPPDSAFRTEAEKFLLSESALDDIDLTDDQYALASNKNNKDIDFDALLEARMLDEGTAAVMNVGDEDVMSGFATLLPGAEGDEEEGGADDDDEARAGSSAELDEEAWRKMQSFEARSIDPQTLQEGYRQLQFLEAQQIDTDEANLVAGMDIAMDIVRAAETVGGTITPADLLLLTSGALAERNVNAAADIARRLALLLAPDSAAALPSSSSSSSQATQQQQQSSSSLSAYDPEFVLQQYERLADMCIAQRAVQQADVVLEAAEVAGLQPSKQILAKLAAAMRGQPRRSERLGRENAALLERAGVDDIDELTATDLNLSASQQQQQLPGDAAAAAAAPPPPAEIAVEALSVVEQQQQGQQDEGQEQLPPELQELADMLEGVAGWQEKQERMRNALRRAGLDEAAIDDILLQPAALMSDPSWLPAYILAATADNGEGVEEGQQEQGQEEGAFGMQQQQGSKSIHEMSFLELAKACANDTLSPEQVEEILNAADAANLPMLYDDIEGRILWPGSSEYETWAQESPAEAAEDEQVMMSMFREQFADVYEDAKQAAQALQEAGVTLEADDAADDDDAQQSLSLKQQYQQALQEMGLLPSSDAAAAAGQDASALAAGSAAEREEMLQELHDSLEQMIAERSDRVQAAFRQLNLPVPDFGLEGGGSSDGSSGSSARKQLTGR